MVGSLRSLAATSVGILKTRLELVAIELAEEKTRLMGLLILALAGLLCLAIGLLMFSFLVVVAFWDTDHRLLSILLVGLVYLVLGIGMLLAVRKKAIDAPIAFEETLAELERDRELLAGDEPDDAYRSRP
nr:phage holin family protein [Pigmentiphaga litoralis]